MKCLGDAGAPPSTCTAAGQCGQCVQSPAMLTMRPGDERDMTSLIVAGPSLVSGKAPGLMTGVNRGIGTVQQGSAGQAWGMQLRLVDMQAPSGLAYSSPIRFSSMSSTEVAEAPLD